MNVRAGNAAIEGILGYPSGLLTPHLEVARPGAATIEEHAGFVKNREATLRTMSPQASPAG